MEPLNLFFGIALTVAIIFVLYKIINSINKTIEEKKAQQERVERSDYVSRLKNVNSISSFQRIDVSSSSNSQIDKGDFKGTKLSYLTDNLVRTTILAVSIFKERNSLLCQSDLTCAETAIFTCFLLRALCIGAAHNREFALKFSNDYIAKIKTAIKQQYMIPEELFEDMFSNRTSFYDYIFSQFNGIENKIAAILEEFEYMIQFDIINKKFKPVNKHLPLSLLGIDDSISCQHEVNLYFKCLPNVVSPYLGQIQDLL